LGELDRFSENIPPELQYQGRNSNISAGLLHMFYACVCMMFWRVFARILYCVPAHLKSALVVERWSALTRWSGESMDWLDAHEHVYDSWILVAYSITSCALVQVSSRRRSMRHLRPQQAQYRNASDRCFTIVAQSHSPNLPPCSRMLASICSFVLTTTCSILQVRLHDHAFGHFTLLGHRLSMHCSIINGSK